MPAPPDRPRRLLFRDREELDRVALLLRGGRPCFAVIACEALLRPAAIAHLAGESGGKPISTPERVKDPERMLELLVEGTGQPASVIRSLAIETSARDVLHTLNLHREKLRGAVSTLLWVDGIEGLGTLREIAPDAYTFRDVVALVSGDQGSPPIAPEEAPALRRARAWLARASAAYERVAARMQLVGALLAVRRLAEAEEVALAALRELPDATSQDALVRELRARIYWRLADVYQASGASAKQHKAAESGLKELALTQGHIEGGTRLRLLSIARAAERPDRALLLESVQAFHRDGGGPDDYLSITQSLVMEENARGDLRSAVQRIHALRGLATTTAADEAILTARSAAIQIATGRLVAGERQLRDSASLLAESGGDPALAIVWLAQCDHLRGELEAAQTLLNDLLRTLKQGDVDFSEALQALGAVLVDSGAVADGLDRLRQAVRLTAEQARDGDHFLACTALVDALRSAWNAERISAADLAAAVTELEIAEGVSLAMVGPEPPWYTILFPGLRSELLALLPERLPDAIDLAKGALDRAKVVCPELIPKEARIYAGHLVRVARFEEALGALQAAEAAAEEQEHLRELAEIRRLILVARVRGRGDDEAARSKLAALCETLGATGSPRIRAETLLQLARDLPPEVRSPDPLALLEEAYALFLEMPMPAREAGCLETVGDVHAARGERPEARRRYLAARRRLERYGLGLRLPLLASKLSRLA